MVPSELYASRSMTLNSLPKLHSLAFCVMKSTGCETAVVCIAQSSAFGKDCKYTSLHEIVTDNNKDVNDDDDHNDDDDNNHDNEDGSYILSKIICSLLFWIKYTTQTSYPT